MSKPMRTADECPRCGAPAAVFETNEPSMADSDRITVRVNHRVKADCPDYIDPPD